MCNIVQRKCPEDSGVTLEWTGGIGWLIYSHPVSVSAAMREYERVMSSPQYDHDPEHWRIVVWTYSPLLHSQRVAYM